MLFSPDGRIILLDAAGKAEVNSWRAHTGLIDRIFFSPDGRLLFSSGALNQAAGVWGLRS